MSGKFTRTAIRLGLGFAFGLTAIGCFDSTADGLTASSDPKAQTGTIAGESTSNSAQALAKSGVSGSNFVYSEGRTKNEAYNNLRATAINQGGCKSDIMFSNLKYFPYFNNTWYGVTANFSCTRRNQNIRP